MRPVHQIVTRSCGAKTSAPSRPATVAETEPLSIGITPLPRLGRPCSGRKPAVSSRRRAIGVLTTIVPQATRTRPPGAAVVHDIGIAYFITSSRAASASLRRRGGRRAFASAAAGRRKPGWRHRAMAAPVRSDSARRRIRPAATFPFVREFMRSPVSSSTPGCKRNATRSANSCRLEWGKTVPGPVAAGDDVQLRAGLFSP